MLDRLRSTLHPEGFHGHGHRPPYFEGWYFKLLDASERLKLAIIPGIYRAPDPANTHAFVQLLDGATGRSAYREFPAADFSCPADRMEIALGNNRFTSTGLKVNVAVPGFAVEGEVGFGQLTPWPVTLTSPGIMGWYAWAPFMECYHGVVSMDHALTGQLTVDGVTHDLTGGRGYIEKDWGRSFPSAWIWMQTNAFGQPGVSLSASIAVIPWIGRAFPGFIIGLLLGGRLYRFATYTGARLESVTVSDTQVIWAVHDGRHRLSMTAARAAGASLKAPSTAAMDRRITESMDATIQVELTEMGSGKGVFSGTACCAGLETGGDLDRLLVMARSLIG